MPTPEEFPNDRTIVEIVELAVTDEPTCAPPGQARAQSPREGTFEAPGEIGLSPPPPPPSREEAARRRFDASSLHGVQATWGRTNRPCPFLDEIILSMGEWQAGILGAQGKAFFSEGGPDDETEEECEIRLRGRNIALGQSYLALHLNGKYSIAAHKREYHRIVGDPPSTTSVLNKKYTDHHRGQLRRSSPAPHAEMLARLEPQFEQALSAVKAGGGYTPDIEEIEASTYDEPFADLTESSLMELLSPKERLALERKLNNEPVLSVAEEKARYRAKQKIASYLTKGFDDMSAASAIIERLDKQDETLARIERIESMRAEAMDKVRVDVEALRARFPDDERLHDATELFHGDGDGSN
jgi:hypothetical protein